MDGRLPGSAQFPFDGIALLRVAEDSRSARVRDALLELGRKRAQHLRRQPDGREAVGA